MSKLQEILDSGCAPGYPTGRPHPSDADVAAPRALRDMENQMGTSTLCRKLGMKPDKLKKIWEIK